MTEDRLREVMRAYAADEPPMTLRAEDVLAAAAPTTERRWRRPLFAAAAVAVLVGGVGVATRGGGPPSGSGVGGGPTSQAASGEALLATIRALGAAAYPSKQVTMSVRSWTPDPGQPGAASTVTGSDLSRATEYRGDFDDGPTSGMVVSTGLSIESTIRPPDAPPPGEPCSPADTSCQQGTLPDGRTVVEREGPVLVWPEQTGVPALVGHTVVVSAADVTVTVTERRAKGEGQGGTWRVSSEALRALAADPRLVPPRPSELPALPSYLACRVTPRPAGCPAQTAEPPASAPPISGGSSGAATSAGSASDSASAGQVKQRILELGRATWGAQATVHLRVGNAGDARVELTEREYPWATNVVGDFLSSDAKHQLVITVQANLGLSTECDAAGDSACRIERLPDGRLARYQITQSTGPTRKINWVARTVRVVDDRVERGVIVQVEEFVYAPLSQPIPDPTALRLTEAQLLAMATDPRLRLAPSVEWPDPVRGFCRPDTHGTRICTAPTGG